MKGELIKVFFLSLAVALSVPNCTTKKDVSAATKLPACFPGNSLPKQEIPKLSYFPPNVFSQKTAVNNMVSNWYTNQLIAAKEMPLTASENEEEVYRLLWLRSFDKPVIVRISHTSLGETILVVKMLSGRGGYEPGQITAEKDIVISSEEWKTFRQFIDKACYWSMKTEEGNDAGNDGAEWILEGTYGDQYHVVERWSPRKGDYREACLYLLELAKMDVGRIY